MHHRQDVGFAGVEKASSEKLFGSVLALGFEVGKSEGTTVTGSITVEKLRALAGVEEVKYVLPRMF